MADMDTFITLTIILVGLGFVMPFVNVFAGGNIITNDVEKLGEGVNTFADILVDVPLSMIKAFFWVYGDLPVFANIIKAILNFIWLVLLAKIVIFRTS